MSAERLAWWAILVFAVAALAQVGDARVEPVTQQDVVALRSEVAALRLVVRMHAKHIDLLVDYVQDHGGAWPPMTTRLRKDAEALLDK